MTIFLDTANLEAIKKYENWGIIKGLTTNQKIFLQEKGVDFKKQLEKILEIMSPLPVSIELTKTNEPLKNLWMEAMDFRKLNNNVVIKVPMWGNGKGLFLARWLQENKVPINLTCCMSLNQAILAGELGVKYVSLFYNRILDFYKGKGGIGTIRETRRFFDMQGYKTKIIAGSIRQPEDVGYCFVAGAHIVTIPPKILQQLPYHPKTEETIKEFDRSWRKFLGR